MEYYLWHTTRQGWLTTNGTTSTQRKDAKVFQEWEAQTRVHQSLDHEGDPILLPVPRLFQWSPL